VVGKIKGVLAWLCFGGVSENKKEVENKMCFLLFHLTIWD
jgi:hypothetical protein